MKDKRLKVEKIKIIHKTIFNKKWLTTDVDERRYLCNQATNITSDKCSYRWNKVTCKNCLKQKPTSLNKDSNIMRNFCLRKNLKSP